MSNFFCFSTTRILLTSVYCMYLLKYFIINSCFEHNWDKLQVKFSSMRTMLSQYYLTQLTMSMFVQVQQQQFYNVLCMSDMAVYRDPWSLPMRQQASYFHSVLGLVYWLIYVRVSTIMAIWTVGHRLRSTPTNRHRFAALSLSWRSPGHPFKY